MPQTSIGQFAEVRTGYQFRGKVVPDDQGNVDVIQIKNVDDRLEIVTPEIDTSRLTRVTIDKPERHLVGASDVLFMARGVRRYGIVVPELRRETVAASQFFVLKPNKDYVLPGYFAWALNQPAFQQQLEYFQVGSHMSLVPLKDFKTCEVDLPDIKTQQQIVHLNELMLKESQLLEQLKFKRAELNKGIFRKLLSGSLKTKDQ